MASETIVPMTIVAGEYRRSANATLVYPAAITITYPTVPTTVLGKTGTAAANQIPYYSDTEQVTTSANFTYNPTTTVTGGVLQGGGNTYTARTGIAWTIGSSGFYVTGDILTSGYMAIHATTPSNANTVVSANATQSYFGASTQAFLRIGTTDQATWSTTQFRLYQNTYVGGNNAPSARIHTAATSTAASTSNFKATNGALMTVKEVGTVELANDWYQTKGDFALRYAIGGAIFDHYADAGNSTTTETDLYSDTIAASQLSINGQGLIGTYYVNSISSPTASSQIRMYFAGTLIFDTGVLAMSVGADFRLSFEIIRESSSIVRVVITATTTSASTIPYVTYTSVSGLTLSNSNILKVTGTRTGVGAATNDIKARLGYIIYKAAA